MATSVPLGTAATYGVLANSAITNTGPTVVAGDLGVRPAGAVTGFPTGTVTGTIHVNDAAAAQAQADLLVGYANAMKPSDTAGRSSLFGRLRNVIRHSPVGRGWRLGRELELESRSPGFAALGLLTLVPLLIVVSGADPTHGRGFAQWLGDGIGVARTSREHIGQLFTRPGQAARTMTAFGVATLAVYGLSLGAAVQTGYERGWERSRRRAGMPGGGMCCGSSYSSGTSSCPPPPRCGDSLWPSRRRHC